MIDLDIHLAAIQLGDADAFGRWLAGAEGPLRACLRSFAASVDTEAVVQEAALRVWQLAPRFVPDGGHNALLRWAVRVAKNLAVSERRRMRAVPTGSDSLEAALDDDIAAAPRLPDPHLRRAIAECNEKLPEQPARALGARLASGGGEPDELLAERLSMRLNTFLQNFTRARRLIAACLEARGIDLDAELT
jgi:DNA-directed RNA polymerase specialized sigma24 family protein